MDQDRLDCIMNAYVYVNHTDDAATIVDVAKANNITLTLPHAQDIWQWWSDIMSEDWVTLPDYRASEDCETDSSDDIWHVILAFYDHHDSTTPNK